MIELKLDDIIELHNMLIEETGGKKGLKRKELLDSAFNSAFQTFDENEMYPTFEEKVARLTYGIVNNHAFNDGNKRIGILIMLILFQLNHYKLNYTQEELIRFGLGLADGTINYSVTIRWIREHHV